MRDGLRIVAEFLAGPGAGALCGYLLAMWRFPDYLEIAAITGAVIGVFGILGIWFRRISTYKVDEKHG